MLMKENNGSSNTIDPAQDPFVYLRFPSWYSEVMQKLSSSWSTRIMAKTEKGLETSDTISEEVVTGSAMEEGRRVSLRSREFDALKLAFFLFFLRPRRVR